MMETFLWNEHIQVNFWSRRFESVSEVLSFDYYSLLYSADMGHSVNHRSSENVLYEICPIYEPQLCYLSQKVADEVPMFYFTPKTSTYCDSHLFFCNLLTESAVGDYIS